MEFVEHHEDTSEIIALRAAAEVRIAQLCASMRLERGGTDELWIPQSGSRILTHTKDCKRQVPHMDFRLESYSKEPYSAVSNASYSIIWTGEDAMPLIVYEGSHRLLQGPPKHTRQMAKTIPPRKVIVPPYSAIVFRGDLLHCGPGQDDFTDEEVDAWTSDHLIRSHIYLGRQKVPTRDVADRETVKPTFPDAIHFYADFDPRPAKQDYWKVGN